MSLTLLVKVQIYLRFNFTPTEITQTMPYKQSLNYNYQVTPPPSYRKREHLIGQTWNALDPTKLYLIPGTDRI